jgi:ABC-type multidrug transport system fused ATPase/permease subunit
MIPLPEEFLCKEVTAKFKMNLSKIQAKFQEKMKKSTDPDRKAEGFYLARPLIMTMMNPLLRSSYLLLVHQVISILLPF